MNSNEVRYWMTRNTQTVQMDDSLALAYSKMLDQNIRHLLVTDKIGHSIGVLSDRDLFKAMTVNRSEEATIFETPQVDFDPYLRTQDMMSWPAITVQEHARLDEACDKLIENKCSALVVQNERTGHACGIITTTDLLRARSIMLKKESESQKNV